MREHAGMAPGKRLLRRANGSVLVAVGVLHEDRADAVRPQRGRKVAAGQPFALEVAANPGARSVDGAAPADPAIDAERTRRLVEMRNLQRRATHRARPAGFS